MDHIRANQFKIAYHVMNSVIVLDTIAQYIIQCTDLKEQYPFGVILPYFALPVGAIVSILYLVSLTPLLNGKIQLGVYYANLGYFSLALAAILLDLLLYFIKPSLYCVASTGTTDTTTETCFVQN